MKAVLTAVSSIILIAMFGGSHFTPPDGPVLTGIKPTAVYPGQIVLVEGTNLENAQVVWDQTNMVIRSTQSVTNYFQVPHDAAKGNHTVRLKLGDQVTDPVTIFVQGLHTHWPAPRIEDISINRLQPVDDNTADFYLAVSAANVDATADVFVNSVHCSSTFYSAIPSGYFSVKEHKPENYGYPVFHYGMLVVYVPHQRFNTTLTVKVSNADGAFAERQYVIPERAGLDSDGDGLLDDWEINGYRVAGTDTRVDLRAMGCDPLRKDILIQVDWMASAVPNSTIWPIIDSIFAGAPVLNPDGSRGISMHIDYGQDAQTGGPFRNGGQTLPDSATIDFCSYPNLGSHVTFKALKDVYFPSSRADLFHYCIFANGRPDGATGRAEIWGDDFMVTFAGTDPDDWANPNAQIGTFIHELGHNLGLFHGGLDCGRPDYHERFKWNQRSSMNYLYQLTGVPVDRGNPAAGLTHSYSEGIDTTITESKLDAKAMNNAMSVTPVGPQTPNKGMNTNQGPVIGGKIQNWNPDETDASDTLVNYDEWGSLKLNFRAVGSGRNTSPCTNIDAPVNCNRVVLNFSADLLKYCGAFRIRLDGSVSMDGGLCAPPVQCGITFPCVPPGDYFASAVSQCDGSRFYWANTDTVKVPNDTTNIRRLHFAADSVNSVSYNLILR